MNGRENILKGGLRVVHWHTRASAGVSVCDVWKQLANIRTHTQTDKPPRAGIRYSTHAKTEERDA